MSDMKRLMETIKNEQPSAIRQAVNEYFDQLGSMYKKATETRLAMEQEVAEEASQLDEVGRGGIGNHMRPNDDHNSGKGSARIQAVLDKLVAKGQLKAENVQSVYNAVVEDRSERELMRMPISDIMEFVADYGMDEAMHPTGKRGRHLAHKQGVTATGRESIHEAGGAINIFFDDINGDYAGDILSFASVKELDVVVNLLTAQRHGTRYHGVDVDPQSVQKQADQILPAGALKDFYDFDVPDFIDNDPAMEKAFAILEPYWTHVEDEEELGLDEAVAPGVPGKNTTFVQKSGINKHGNPSIRESDDEEVDECNESEELDEELQDLMRRSGMVMETGDGNAQQKGINFDGSKAAKGDGVLPRKGPKAKTTGNNAPLATVKSATKVGQIKS